MLLSVSITLAVVIIDQISKWWAVNYLQPMGDFTVIPGFLSVSYHRNMGAALGILKNHRWIFLIVSIIAILAIIAFLVYMRNKGISRLLLISLSLLLGGGIGNMIDRTFFGEKLFSGAVIDFLDLRFFDSTIFIFNFADAAVTVGEVLLLIYIIFIEFKKINESEKESYHDK